MRTSYDGWGQTMLTQDDLSSITAPPSRRDTVHSLGGNGTLATTVNAAPGIQVFCQARVDPWGSPRQPTSGDLERYCSSGNSHSDAGYRLQRRDPLTGTYQLGARTDNPPPRRSPPPTATGQRPPGWTCRSAPTR